MTTTTTKTTTTTMTATTTTTTWMSSTDGQLTSHSAHHTVLVHHATLQPPICIALSLALFPSLLVARAFDGSIFLSVSSNPSSSPRVLPPRSVSLPDVVHVFLPPFPLPTAHLHEQRHLAIFFLSPFPSPSLFSPTRKSLWFVRLAPLQRHCITYYVM